MFSSLYGERKLFPCCQKESGEHFTSVPDVKGEQRANCCCRAIKRTEQRMRITPVSSTKLKSWLINVSFCWRIWAKEQSHEFPQKLSVKNWCCRQPKIPSSVDWVLSLRWSKLAYFFWGLSLVFSCFFPFLIPMPDPIRKKRPWKFILSVFTSADQI